MMKLIIIGNGFDIAHGLRTKYSDFMEYIFGSELYRKLSEYIIEDELWASLEEALGYLDYEQLKDDNSSYMLGYGDDNWRDSANHDYQFMIGDSLNFIDELLKELYYWIGEIDTRVDRVVNLIPLLQPENIYMNFNYTNTLEETYLIPKGNINYIHGNAKRGENRILGHHDNSLWINKPNIKTMSAAEYELYIEYQSGIDFREVEVEEIIESYFKNTYKDTRRIISLNQSFFESIKEVKQVYVLGHSYSEIDLEYFDTVKKHVNEDCEWILSWYSEKDKRSSLEMMDKLDITNYIYTDILKG